MSGFKSVPSIELTFTKRSDANVNFHKNALLNGPVNDISYGMMLSLNHKLPSVQVVPV